MKPIRLGTLAVVVSLIGFLQAQTQKNTHAVPDKERLIGAWHLTGIEAPGPDGKLVEMAQPKGMLIYTGDGHMSVQLMYPKPTIAGSDENEYVSGGYEASFGSYDVDEATHTVTHHVQGSITRELLVGRNLPRRYQFSGDGHLIIKSSRVDERWSVTWEHY